MVVPQNKLKRGSVGADMDWKSIYSSFHHNIFWGNKEQWKQGTTRLKNKQQTLSQNRPNNQSTRQLNISPKVIINTSNRTPENVEASRQSLVCFWFSSPPFLPFWKNSDCEFDGCPRPNGFVIIKYTLLYGQVKEIFSKVFPMNYFLFSPNIIWVCPLAVPQWTDGHVGSWGPVQPGETAEISWKVRGLEKWRQEVS